MGASRTVGRLGQAIWRTAFRIVGALSTLALLVIVAFFWWLGPTTDDPATVEELTAAFADVTSGVLPARLSGAARLVLVGRRGPGADTAAHSVMRVFERMTGIPSEVADGEAWSEFRIDFVPRARFTELAALGGGTATQLARLSFEARCYELSGRGTEQIVIPDSLSDSQAAQCVAHELMHAFGFGGHPKVQSVLNQRGAWLTLTRNDLVLLRTLYDERLQPGMSADEVMRLVPIIIAELLRLLEGAADPVEALARR